MWAHPQVVGFIDIIGPRNGPLQPVITRDEFKNTRGRTEAYTALIEACESQLIRAIEAANEVRATWHTSGTWHTSARRNPTRAPLALPSAPLRIHPAGKKAAAGTTATQPPLLRSRHCYAAC